MDRIDSNRQCATRDSYDSYDTRQLRQCTSVRQSAHIVPSPAASDSYDSTTTTALAVLTTAVRQLLRQLRQTPTVTTATTARDQVRDHRCSNCTRGITRGPAGVAHASGVEWHAITLLSPKLSLHTTHCPSAKHKACSVQTAQLGSGTGREASSRTDRWSACTARTALP